MLYLHETSGWRGMWNRHAAAHSGKKSKHVPFEKNAKKSKPYEEVLEDIIKAVRQIMAGISKNWDITCGLVILVEGKT